MCELGHTCIERCAEGYSKVYVDNIDLVALGVASSLKCLVLYLEDVCVCVREGGSVCVCERLKAVV